MSIWTRIKAYFTERPDKRIESIATESAAQEDKYDSSPVVYDAPDTARLLVVSDLHWESDEDWSAFKEALTAEPDAVCLLGDIPPGDAEYLVSLVPEGIPILYVLGNHDQWHDYDGIACLTCVDGTQFALPDGTVIGGVSGAPRYKADPDWAMRNEDECKEVLDRLGHADILLSHESPWRMMAERSSHSGFQAITDYVASEKPALHIFGHHHWPEEKWRNGTKHICVFRCALISYPGGQVEQVF